MLNLLPKETNTLIVYSDTVSPSTYVGDSFLLVFINSYSKQAFGVVPQVTKRNKRFIEFTIELIGVDQQNDIEAGQIYLFPEGNFEYIALNTSENVLSGTGGTGPLDSATWESEGDFWNYAKDNWTLCGINFTEIDRGQAFLLAEDVCENEIKYVEYESDNELLKSVVYVAGVPLSQFPCTIEEEFTVDENTTTYCAPVTVLNGATLLITFNKYGQC